MTENPFATGQSPVHLELPLRRLPNWMPEWRSEPVMNADGELPYVVNPQALPQEKQMKDAETATPQRLVPYGSTHIRLTTLPLVPAENA